MIKLPGGYIGKVLKVNLSLGKWVSEPLVKEGMSPGEAFNNSLRVQPTLLQKMRTSNNLFKPLCKFLVMLQ
jgi:hypothetical protein